jgi:hypothetical protein
MTVSFASQRSNHHCDINSMVNNPPAPGDAGTEPVRLDQVPALLDKKAERLRAAFTAIRDQR